MSQATHGAIAQITEVVARVTRILSQRSIQVIQEGLKIGVEYDHQGAPAKVYIPSLSDNPNPELIAAIQGFVDREVSHLLYTDHEYKHRMGATREFKKGMAKSLQDIIEDSRTERAMRKEFRGSAANFNKNHDFAVEQIIAPKHATETDPKKRMANLTMPAIRAACGDLAYEEFMDGKWEELGPLGGAILHYAEDIQNAESTEETYELTRKIMRMMQEGGGGGGDGDDDDEGDEGDDEGEGQGGSAGGQGGGKGQKSKGKGQGQAGESDGDPSEDEGEGEGNGDAEDDGEGEGKDKGEGEGEGEDESEGEGKDGKDDESSSNGENKSKKELVDLTKKNKNLDKRNKSKNKPSGQAGPSDGIQNFEDYDDAYEAADWNAAVQKHIKKIAKDDAIKAKYIPYSRRCDYVGPFLQQDKAIAQFGRDQVGQKIYNHAKENSHVIQQQVQKLFMAKALVRWEPGLKRGKINPSQLSRLRLGDDRVFRRKIESNSRDVAVSLLMDMSGSMSNAKIQYACISALMFSQVLTTLNIPHEISAFTTYTGYGRGYDNAKGYPSSEEVNKMLSSVNRYSGQNEGVSYARYTPIMNYIAKGYDDRLTEETKKLVAMIPSGYSSLMSSNIDGECVDLAGQRLLRRKEKKKVMIVMSDGLPAGDGDGRVITQHLKDVVKQLMGHGIEVLGLGLMDTAVKQFYPKNEIVHRVEDIPTKILELTRQMVVGV